MNKVFIFHSLPIPTPHHLLHSLDVIQGPLIVAALEPAHQQGPLIVAALEPAHQVLVRLRLFRFVAEPLDELTRRAAREGPESVQTAQLGQMLVPGLGPHRVVGELVPVEVELAAPMFCRSSSLRV